MFKIGDLVTLKSGGPTMTVCSPPAEYGYASHQSVEAQWFDGSKVMDKVFPVEALKKVDDHN